MVIKELPYTILIILIVCLCVSAAGYTILDIDEENTYYQSSLNYAEEIQEAVDNYYLQNKNYPVKSEQPTPLEPQKINFSDIYPKYLSEPPSNSDFKYWVDFEGKVWFSTVDTPTGVNIDKKNILFWNKVDGANFYKIYELAGDSIEIKTLDFNGRVKLDFVKFISNNSSEVKKDYDYAVSAIDNYSFESVPSGRQ